MTTETTTQQEKTITVASKGSGNRKAIIKTIKAATTTTIAMSRYLDARERQYSDSEWQPVLRASGVSRFMVKS
ncbi:hypothetical protein [Bifidobacterium tsurumiense]|uniref:hypothetical protein n=1 Tax=Bifidobacterium tsurumiense TaxID=356829 RepID=UPI00047D10AA|nr:hypothetical protein [Bifidobacterium tsurumiense]